MFPGSLPREGRVVEYTLSGRPHGVLPAVETEVKCCAFILFRLYVHRSSVFIDDTFDDIQTDAGSRIPLFGMETLKRLEQSVRLRHIETDPIISDEIGPAIVPVLLAYLNAGISIFEVNVQVL
jgi:hypothetical protein